MNLPGFSAEASIYRGRSYRSGRLKHGVPGGVVHPAFLTLNVNPFLLGWAPTCQHMKNKCDNTCYSVPNDQY